MHTCLPNGNGTGISFVSPTNGTTFSITDVPPRKNTHLQPSLASSSESWFASFPQTHLKHHLKHHGKAFTGPRVTARLEDICERIKQEAEDETRASLDLICFSAMFQKDTLLKELPNGEPLMGFACVVDLDVKKPDQQCKLFSSGECKAWNADELKQAIQTRVDRGCTMRELAEECSLFQQTVEAALVLVARLEELEQAGVERVACWFTGSKGFRVVWWDERGYYAYRKGDPVSNSVMSGLLPELVGGSTVAKVQSLCDLDKNIYDVGKGVKTDLQRHHKTGFWPFRVSREQLEHTLGISNLESPQDVVMKRSNRDIKLCSSIASYWEHVFRHVPQWECAKQLAGASGAGSRPEGGGGDGPQSMLIAGGARSKVPNGAGRKRSAAGGPGGCLGAGGKRQRHCEATLSSSWLPGHRGSGSAELFQSLCCLALVAVSPSVGSGYDTWRNVFFALLNSVGDSKLTLEVFNQWSSAADGYKGMEDIQQLFGRETPRDGRHSFGISSLLAWASSSPALVLCPRGPDEAGYSDHHDDLDGTSTSQLTAAALLKRCNFEKSSWQFVVRASVHLFAGEKEAVVSAVCWHLCSMGWGREQARLSVEAIWALPAGSSKQYTDALKQYVEAKLMDVDQLVSELFPSRPESQDGLLEQGAQFQRVRPSYFVSLEDGKESVVFWASVQEHLDASVSRCSADADRHDHCDDHCNDHCNGISNSRSSATGGSAAGGWSEVLQEQQGTSEAEPGDEMGGCQTQHGPQSEHAGSQTESQERKLVVQPFCLHLRTMSVRHCLSGETVEGMFPLQVFFAQSNGPTGPVSLAKFLGKNIASFSPIRFDTAEKEWRHFRSDLGLWARSSSMDLGPKAARLSCTDPTVLLSDCVRSLALPLLSAARFLERCCKTKESRKEQQKQMGKRTEMLFGFMVKYCETHHFIAKVLESLAACNTMQSTFDTQPAHLICCPNGIVDLRSGSLIPAVQLAADNGVWARALELTEEQFCATPFLPFSALTVTINSFFLQHLLPPDVYKDAKQILDTLQMFLGYRLTGETNVHQAWLLTGEGANMKSLLSKWMYETLGEHFVAMLAAKDLNFKSSDNNDAIYASRRKRSWYINESGSRNQWDEEMFKGLTGGECLQGVSAKYKSEARFRPVAKLMAFVNELPDWSSPDAFALHRRCAVLQLRVCYAANDAERENLLQKGVKPEWIREADPDFYEQHMAQHRQSLLAWMVEGAAKYYSSSKKIPLPACLQRHDMFSKQVDMEEHVKDFLAGTVQQEEGRRLPLEWIYVTFLAEWSFAASDIPIRRFNKMCRTVCEQRFPKVHVERSAKVSAGNLTTKVLTCMMNLTWADTKREELVGKYGRIREDSSGRGR
jgi:phage/plasmid-associated DNA primase